LLVLCAIFASQLLLIILTEQRGGGGKMNPADPDFKNNSLFADLFNKQRGTGATRVDTL